MKNIRSSVKETWTIIIKLCHKEKISWVSFQQNQTSLVNQFQILSLPVHVWEAVQWLASSLCLSLASCPFFKQVLSIIFWDTDTGSQYHILAHRHQKLNIRGEIRTIVGYLFSTRILWKTLTHYFHNFNSIPGSWYIYSIQRFQKR